MKVNDLMNGIYVYFNCFDGSKIIVKVTGFNDNIVYGNSKHGSHWANINEVEPIPLTTDILKLIGFNKSVPPPGIHAKCYEVENKEEKYHLTIADYNKYKRLLLNVDFEDAECFNIKCDYVHRLQLALKMCGIKKEINL